MNPRVVPAALLIVGFAVVALAALDPESPPWAGARAFLTPLYLVLGPGWVIATTLRGSSLAFSAVLAVASGLAVAVVAGQVMVLTGTWHPVGLLFALAAVVQPALVVLTARRVAS